MTTQPPSEPCRTSGQGRKASLIPLLGLMLVVPAIATAERIEIGRFSVGSLEGWGHKSFVSETLYTLQQDGNRRALRADSQASASGLYYRARIDLNRTPYLNWSWRVDNLLPGHDERTKAGDDYSARIYVVFSGGLMFWRTRAINYVWSSNQPVGSEWPNAFTANARMIAVRSSATAPGIWVSEKRDVRADYRRLFGTDPGLAEAVAIMTDSDNTGLAARAWYGDIWFSSE